MHAKEISDDLRRQGSFIHGVRPGKETKEYLKTQYKYLCDNNLSNEIRITIQNLNPNLSPISYVLLNRFPNDLCACRFL